MRAATMRNWELRVDEVPEPVPGPGQALVRTLACGICGSDLHLLRHGARQLALTAELSEGLPPDPTRPVALDPAHDVVMGHEFCAEVVELGPDCHNLNVGDRVVSMPVAFDAGGVHALGFSNRYPGGYAELMVLNDTLALQVPNGLDHRLAALTEPLAVGVHAVNKSGIVQGEAALVLGCGPVGLAVIADLAMRGIEPIVAADFSPTRRRLAAHLGAHEVVDPRDERAIDAWRRVDGTRPLVIFEAVGVPGMIDQAMVMAPRATRILVVGACMEDDTIRPLAGIGRELTIQFALAYEPHEFAGALQAIAEGRVDVAPLITGTVDVDGVPQAFVDLADPEAHAKILVEPGA
ncbi:MAG: zinc-binding dehydrogenase [Acidimicrobiales bacterium]|nr:zinc-binding dehydrogenase [Acidimicrobiales bacterium]